MKCDAIQHSDQMVCDTCTQAWDVNDPHPPKCTKQPMHDLAVAAFVMEKNLLRLITAGRETGCDMTDEIQAVERFNEVLKSYNIAPGTQLKQREAKHD